MDSKRQKTIVIGAGPVGALASLYTARRGHDVEVYELRGDPRDASTVPLNFTKSINLALSERGINSLKCADSSLLDAVMGDTIPMYGRMIHGEQNGQFVEQSQLYDAQGRCIRAIDRNGLNKRLLDELEKWENVKFFFNHKLVGADFKRNMAWMERSEPTPELPSYDWPKQEVEITFDFMIGADGSHSATRYHLMKFARMYYEQEYIDTLWCEFYIGPKATADGPEFRLSSQHLHIWPGGDFMFIAIPSLDKSFTATLFLPAKHFAVLDGGSQDSLVAFFKEHFPGVVPDLISESDLEKQYRQNPHLPLISIKTTPYHFKSSVVILGDAAHAMVPFYGQGMNAGLEDVRVLFDFIDKFNPESSSLSDGDSAWRARAKALEEYSKYRTPDAFAINDLALRNYEEMRSDVVSPVYKARKWIEEQISLYFPRLGWATQYSRVSFGNWRYSEVDKAATEQKQTLLGGMGIILGVTTGSVLWLLSRRDLGPWMARSVKGLAGLKAA